MPPAFFASRAGAMPEASRDRSSGTFGKQILATLHRRTTSSYSMITSIWLRFSAVLLTCVSAHFFTWVCEMTFKSRLGGRPLPYLTQGVLDCRYGFLLIAAAWLVWAILGTRSAKKGAFDSQVFDAASLLVVAAAISILAISMPLALVSLFPFPHE